MSTTAPRLSGPKKSAGEDSPTTPAPLAFGLMPAWWPVALTDEVTGKPRAVGLGNRELVVFRTPAGAVRAVDDRCPHRRLPLSMGWVTEDGDIQCGYHGWCFDGATGRCTRIPNLRHDERPSPRLGVTAFLTGEVNHRRPIATEPVSADDPQMQLALTMFTTSVADGFVHVWSGDPARREPPPTADVADEDTGAPVAPEALSAGRLRGETVARSPYRRVTEALMLNPGLALGLGWLLGSGDEMSGPVIDVSDDLVVVRRERLIQRRGRVASFGPIIGRTVQVRIETRADTGLTRLVTEGPGTFGADLVVGLTPLGPYRTVVRWHGRLLGHGASAAALAASLSGSVMRRTRSIPDALERLADETEGVLDPGLRCFREAGSKFAGSPTPTEGAIR